LSDRWAVLGTDDEERGGTLIKIIERFGNTACPFPADQVEIEKISDSQEREGSSPMKVIAFNANPEWESSAEKKKQMLTLIGKPKHIKIHHSCITLSLLNRPHHIQGEEDGRRGTNSGAGEARGCSASPKSQVRGQVRGEGLCQGRQKRGRKRTRGNGDMGGRSHIILSIKNKISIPFPIPITIAFISKMQLKYKYLCNFLILGCRGPGIEEMDSVRFGFRILLERSLVPTMHSNLFIFEWVPLYYIRSQH
jgi:hypothetical protein